MLKTTLEFAMITILLVAGFLYLQSQLPKITEGLQDRLVKAAEVK
jgi:hypothetical protein